MYVQIGLYPAPNLQHLNPFCLKICTGGFQLTTSGLSWMSWPSFLKRTGKEWNPMGHVECTVLGAVTPALSIFVAPLY